MERSSQRHAGARPKHRPLRRRERQGRLFALILVAICCSGAGDPASTAATPPVDQIKRADAGQASITVAEIAAAAAVASALVALASAIFNEARRRRNDRKIAEFNASVQERLLELKREADLELARRTAELKAQADLQLARFKTAADDQLSAEAARRAYEYEARKRLYQDCEPLLFQLSQNARVAIGRIISLARYAREGLLDADDGPVSGDMHEANGRGYYFRSTLYQLLAPLAVTYILRTRLTFLDTSLDPWTNRQFILADAAYQAFTRDFFFAETAPAIAGYGGAADGADMQERLATHHKQGVFLGWLDTAVSRLVEQSERTMQVITFGAFEKRILDSDPELEKAMQPFVLIFSRFHPARCPVTWRILVAQYFIYRAIRLARRADLERGERESALDDIVLSKRTLDDLNWKPRSEWRQLLDAEVAAPAKIGRLYLARTLGLDVATRYPGGAGSGERTIRGSADSPS